MTLAVFWENFILISSPQWLSPFSLHHPPAPEKPEGWTKASWKEYWVASVESNRVLLPFLFTWPSFQWPLECSLSLNTVGPGASVHHGLVRRQHMSFLIYSYQISSDSNVEDEVICGGEHSLWCWGYWKCLARHYRAFPSVSLASSPKFLFKAGGTSPFSCSLRQFLSKSASVQMQRWCVQIWNFPPQKALKADHTYKRWTVPLEDI